MNKLDPAIASLLGLDPLKTQVRSGGGGSSSARTYRIDTEVDGEMKQYFVKTASGETARTMLVGEDAGLNAIANAVPGLAPQSLGHGELQSSDGYFLATEYINMTARSTRSPEKSLAQKLAKLHTTPAPVSEGYEQPQFGFPVSTCCGNTVQPNHYSPSWADFFAKHRIGFMKEEIIRNQGSNRELSDVLDRVSSKIVPRLLADDHLNGGHGVVPVVVHGDIWSGNTGSGQLPGMISAEDIIFDPSASYAHNEYDLGIMGMFGGFSSHFFKEYHNLCPKTEPVEEYDDRITLYQAYHHLNHYAMFGGGYKGSALRLLRQLLQKYDT